MEVLSLSVGSLLPAKDSFVAVCYWVLAQGRHRLLPLQPGCAGGSWQARALLLLALAAAGLLLGCGARLAGRLLARLDPQLVGLFSGGKLVLNLAPHLQEADSGEGGKGEPRNASD